MKDEKGQMHVLEVMISALLFMAAMSIAVNVSTPSSEQQSINQLKTLGNDSLLALDNTPCNDLGYYNSTLVKFIFSNDIKNLTLFFNKTLSSSISYSITLLGNGKNTLVYSMGKAIGDSIVSHFPIFYNGKLYDVQLLMWHEPRG